MFLLTLPVFAALMTLLNLVPIALVSWRLAKCNVFSWHMVYQVISGFFIFNLGLLSLFWALYAMIGGGHASPHTFWYGLPFLALATVFLALALHILALSKKIALVFFLMPVLSYFIPGATNIWHLLASWVDLIFLPLSVIAYWCFLRLKKKTAADTGT